MERLARANKSQAEPEEQIPPNVNPVKINASRSLDTDEEWDVQNAENDTQ